MAIVAKMMNFQSDNIKKEKKEHGFPPIFNQNRESQVSPQRSNVDIKSKKRF